MPFVAYVREQTLGRCYFFVNGAPEVFRRRVAGRPQFSCSGVAGKQHFVVVKEVLVFERRCDFLPCAFKAAAYFAGLIRKQKPRRGRDRRCGTIDNTSAHKTNDNLGGAAKKHRPDNPASLLNETSRTGICIASASEGH